MLPHNGANKFNMNRKIIRCMGDMAGVSAGMKRMTTKKRERQNFSWGKWPESAWRETMASFRNSRSRLYCGGRDAGSNRLVCLASDDNGDAWRDHAVSEAVINPYAIGGCREVTADDWIIGPFTDQTSEGGGKVYFFRIPAARKP